MRSIYIIFLSGFLSIFSTSCDSSQATNQEAEQDNSKKEKKPKKEKESVSAGVSLEKTWELPPMLREISGLAYLGSNRFACVQDESGALFIYDTSKEEIQKQISFGAAGDYEGIAVAGKNAYVVRSDGQLFELLNFDGPNKPNIKSYATGLTAKNNVEGLTYDSGNNRLLLAIKGTEGSEKDFKGIYAYNLATHKLQLEPVFKINLTDSVFQDRQTKKLTAAMQPSDLAINPTTGDIYVLEGTNPQVIILDGNSKIKSRFVLDKNIFKQPEGLTFGPNGDLYICNEGGKKLGNISKVTLSD